MPGRSGLDQRKLERTVFIEDTESITFAFKADLDSGLQLELKQLLGAEAVYKLSPDRFRETELWRGPRSVSAWKTVT